MQQIKKRTQKNKMQISDEHYKEINDLTIFGTIYCLLCSKR